MDELNMDCQYVEKFYTQGRRVLMAEITGLDIAQKEKADSMGVPLTTAQWSYIDSKVKEARAVKTLECYSCGEDIKYDGERPECYCNDCENMSGKTLDEIPDDLIPLFKKWCKNQGYVKTDQGEK